MNQPMSKWFHKNKNIRNYVLILISILVVSLFPLPYYVEVPGSADNLTEFVTVDGKKDQNPGSFMLTTVGIRQGTPLFLAIAKLHPFQEIVTKKELMEDSDNAEYEQLQEYYMESSQNTAIKVAFDLAKKPYEIEYAGIYVMNIEKNSDFKSELQPGDTVYEIDGQRFKNAQGFMDYVKNRRLVKL